VELRSHASDGLAVVRRRVDVEVRWQRSHGGDTAPQR
jgi:hypothetical protein